MSDLSIIEKYMSKAVFYDGLNYAKDDTLNYHLPSYTILIKNCSNFTKNTNVYPGDL